MKIKSLFYEFLLHHNAEITGKTLKANYGYRDISPDVLEFIRYWTTYDNIILQNVTWDEACVDFDIDHKRNRVDVVITYENRRNYELEREFKSEIADIFTNYIINLFPAWESNYQYGGMM